ncbi:MAG: thermonuclease family protein [Alphaproteobacteria bacterium]|nr:thermonuclease family protein [Alphaproteobacteria bacterium]
MYEYQAKVDRIIDGDTIDLLVDLGFYTSTLMRVRLRGVDAPEVRGVERPEGLLSTAFVNEQIPAGTKVLIRTYKIGKFGRYIADILYIPGKKEPALSELQGGACDLAQEMLKAGYAEPYDM